MDGWEFGLDIRDPERALHFAELANEKTDYANPDYLDTLALTYSELGRLRDAIELERKALSLMEDGHRDKAAYQKRVESWEAALHGAASN
jgi:serine/threonine-protein kinase